MSLGINLGFYLGPRDALFGATECTGYSGFIWGHEMLYLGPMVHCLGLRGKPIGDEEYKHMKDRLYSVLDSRHSVRTVL
mgnify:CR=1 FL=1